MGKKSRERKERKQNMHLTRNENKVMRKDIYDKLHVGVDEFPFGLWFSEEPEKNEDPQWEELVHWAEQSGPQKSPHRVPHTFPDIMHTLRSLVENVTEKIESGKETKDVINVYHIIAVLDAPSDGSSGMKLVWSSFVVEVGANVRKSFLSFSGLEKMNPFLSSWMATKVMDSIVEKYKSVLDAGFAATGRDPFAPVRKHNMEGC